MYLDRVHVAPLDLVPLRVHGHALFADYVIYAEPIKRRLTKAMLQYAANERRGDTTYRSWMKAACDMLLVLDDMKVKVCSMYSTGYMVLHSCVKV